MVELAKKPYQALQQNQTMLKAEHAVIVNQDAIQFLANNKQAFDVIFCDPPYNQAWLDKLLPELANHIAVNGVVYAEAEYQLSPSVKWDVIKQGKAGHVYYHLLKSAASI